MHGFHHLRERARVTQGLEPFPSRSFKLRTVDRLMYGVGFLAPLTLLPQIFQIYSTKSSEGVSLLTWVLLTCTGILWTIYGAMHKDTHILFASGFMIIFHLTIVVGLMIY